MVVFNSRDGIAHLSWIVLKKVKPAICQSGVILLIILFAQPFSVSSLSQYKQQDKMKPKVVIIGAGASGIGAASKLMQNGITDITILEAMDRIGGRIYYRELGDYGGVDLGAHWVHGQFGNVVYELAKPLGLVDHSGDNEHQKFFRSDGTELDLGHTTSGLSQLQTINVSDTDSYKKDQSFADIINERVKNWGETYNISTEDIKSLQLLSNHELCALESCLELSDVSIKTSMQYDEPDGDRLVEWKTGGMANVIDLLMGTHVKSPWKGLGVESKVKLTNRVSNIDWSSEEVVRITTENGDTLSADFVIFTPSLNVLKRKHGKLFSPALPQDKVDAIEGLGMDVVDKVYLVFKDRWWPENISNFNLLHRKKFPTETQDWSDSVITFSSENHNQHVLCAWFTNSGAKQMELASDEEVKDTVVGVLRKFVGKKFEIPNPILVVRSRWWNTEDVGGSYSYNSVRSDHLATPREDLGRPLVNKEGRPVVLFAGEATNQNHYSTVHGALETGWREADRILNFYKNHE